MLIPKSRTSEASLVFNHGICWIGPIEVLMPITIAKVPKLFTKSFSKYFGFKEPKTNEEKAMDLAMRLKLAQGGLKDKLEEEFTARIQKCFKVRAVNQFVTKNKFRLDSLLFRENSAVPFALIEFKRGSIELSLDSHGDQIYTSAIEIIRQFPNIGSLEIILTNGWDLMYGRMRKSYSNIKIEISKSKLCLYERETGKLCEDSLDFLFHLLQKPQHEEWPMEIELKESFVFSDSTTARTRKRARKVALKDVVIDNLSGIGGHSVVYSCKVGGKCGYVLKAFQVQDHYQSELENNNTLKELKIFPDLMGYSGLHSMLLYERFDPVVPTFYGQDNVRTLEVMHIKQLYDNLVKLHNDEYCHRDVRLENIVLKGDEAFLIDIAGCAVLDRPVLYHGSRETASQRVLQEIIDKKDEPKIFAFTAADDLESLLKVFMMILFPSVREELKCISTYEGYLKAWKKWMVVLIGFQAPASSEQWHAVYADLLPRLNL